MLLSSLEISLDPELARFIATKCRPVLLKRLSFKNHCISFKACFPTNTGIFFFSTARWWGRLGWKILTQSHLWRNRGICWFTSGSKKVSVGVYFLSCLAAILLSMNHSVCLCMFVKLLHVFMSPMPGCCKRNSDEREFVFLFELST